MVRISLLKWPCVKVEARRSFSMSSKVRMGCDTSRRITGSVWSGESRFGRGPMNDTSDITSCSRIGSIGGVGTCPESWPKDEKNGLPPPPQPPTPPPLPPHPPPSPPAPPPLLHAPL